MGITDALRRLRGSKVTFQGQEIVYDLGHVRDEVMGMSPAEVWRTQPHLRTVVTFMARNIAQLGVHAFQRVDESDRQRLRDADLARYGKRPGLHHLAPQKAQVIPPVRRQRP